tara:strand:- start:832 stop:1110 length:279 start_codon:yes stop_codon:yes gene_type:complete
MKITKRQLKRIIREEYSRIFQEGKFTEEPTRYLESNEVLQFIEDSMENGYAPDEISPELTQAFSRADLEIALDSEDVEGWSIAVDIIEAALR